MNAMRLWMHESELATYLQGQRASLKAMTPTTPGFPPLSPASRIEDLRQVDHALVALQGLKMRLANYEELIGHVDHFIQYLQGLQRELPIPAPEQSFSRLQTLRNILFWLPPALLRTSESDLGPIAVLSHFFAAALAVETLFPEIGGTYFGTISIVPIEKMYEVMRSRRNASPQDAGLQVAMSLLEAPMQLLSTYRIRQEQQAQITPGYHQTPSQFITSHPYLPSSPGVPTNPIYVQTSVRSPGVLATSAPSYFQHIPQQTSSHHRPPPPTSPLDRSMSAGATGLAPLGYASPPVQSAYQSQPPFMRHDSAPGVGYYNPQQTNMQPYGNPRFVSPSQVWT